jgi:DinB family protein
MWGGTDDLVEMLRTTPVVLRTLVRGVDDERARMASATGDWSVVEVAAHLADADEKAIDRIVRMTGEDEPVIEGYDQIELAERRGYWQMHLSTVLDRFEQLRAERVDLLAPLDAAAWERTGRHTQEGVITLYQLTLHMCQHDANHLRQVARIVET